MEILCLIHERDIPELEAIRHRREDEKARRDDPLRGPDASFGIDPDSSTEIDSEFDEFEEEDDPPLHSREKASPVRVEKIGRNQPCPCGSGKKYKKCCLDKQ